MPVLVPCADNVDLHRDHSLFDKHVADEARDEVNRLDERELGYIDISHQHPVVSGQLEFEHV